MKVLSGLSKSPLCAFVMTLVYLCGKNGRENSNSIQYKRIF